MPAGDGGSCVLALISMLLIPHRSMCPSEVVEPQEEGYRGSAVMDATTAVLASQKYIFVLESGVLEGRPPHILSPFCMRQIPFLRPCHAIWQWWEITSRMLVPQFLDP